MGRVSEALSTSVEGGAWNRYHLFLEDLRAVEVCFVEELFSVVEVCFEAAGSVSQEVCSVEVVEILVVLEILVPINSRQFFEYLEVIIEQRLILRNSLEGKIFINSIIECYIL